MTQTQIKTARDRRIGRTVRAQPYRRSRNSHYVNARRPARRADAYLATAIEDAIDDTFSVYGLDAI